MEREVSPCPLWVKSGHQLRPINVRFTPESGHRNRPAYYLRRTSSGSLAIFAAIRRDSWPIVGLTERRFARSVFCYPRYARVNAAQAPLQSRTCGLWSVSDRGGGRNTSSRERPTSLRQSKEPVTFHAHGARPRAFAYSLFNTITPQYYTSHASILAKPLRGGGSIGVQTHAPPSATRMDPEAVDVEAPQERRKRHKHYYAKTDEVTHGIIDKNVDLEALALEYSLIARGCDPLR